MTNQPLTVRKIPRTVQAMQMPETYPDGVDPSSDGYARNLQAAAVVDWLRDHLGEGYDPTADERPETGWTIDPGTGFLLISTLEGVMQVNPRDWVIRGVQGEFYPCKPDIFAETYEILPA